MHAWTRFLSGFLPLLLALSPVPSAQGLVKEVHFARTWTVNAAGGADFVDLPQAVRTAHSGDVLLVAPGDYTGFALRGKGLTILGDGGIPRIAGPTVRVVGVPAGEEVVLRYLELVASDPDATTILWLEDNAGSVWIEKCTLRSELDYASFGMLAVDSASVVVVRTSVTTPSGLLALSAGLYALRSAVYAYESSFEAELRINYFIGGGDSGATLRDSFLYAAGCTFQGAQGVPGICSAATGLCASTPGPGGPGLDARLSGTVPITLSCTFLGGPGGGGWGISYLCFCPTVPSGPPFLGTVLEEPLPRRSYRVTSPVAGGTSTKITALCEPNEAVWSVFAQDLAPAYVPTLFGTEVSPLPLTYRYEGLANSTGRLTKDVPIPPLAALTSFERLYVQGLFFDDLDNAYLGSPSVLVVVP